MRELAIETATPRTGSIPLAGPVLGQSLYPSHWIIFSAVH